MQMWVVPCEYDNTAFTVKESMCALVLEYCGSKAAARSVDFFSMDFAPFTAASALPSFCEWYGDDVC